MTHPDKLSYEELNHRALDLVAEISVAEVMLELIERIAQQCDDDNPLKEPILSAALLYRETKGRHPWRDLQQRS